MFFNLFNIFAQQIIMKTAQEYYNSGLAKEESQQFESAIEDYTEAIKLDTKYRDNFKELREICNLKAY